jgi:hypothetical protein
LINLLAGGTSGDHEVIVTVVKLKVDLSYIIEEQNAEKNFLRDLNFSNGQSKDQPNVTSNAGQFKMDDWLSLSPQVLAKGGPF